MLRTEFFCYFHACSVLLKIKYLSSLLLLSILGLYRKQLSKAVGSIDLSSYQESGYQLLHGRHYKSLGPSPYGRDAEAICIREGGHLPTLRTQEDVEDIHGLRGAKL